MRRFLQVIRFDASDDHVFELAASPGEWALPGGFAFAALDDGALTGKRRQAFANGFLGLNSFGWSTFVVVAEISDDDWQASLDRLAHHLCERYGAPDQEAARAAAAGEMAFGAELAAGKPVNTVLTIRRFIDGEGQIHEEFRAIRPPSAPDHARIWDVTDDD